MHACCLLSLEGAGHPLLTAGTLSVLSRSRIPLYYPRLAGEGLGTPCPDRTGGSPLHRRNRDIFRGAASTGHPKPSPSPDFTHRCCQHPHSGIISHSRECIPLSPA